MVERKSRIGRPLLSGGDFVFAFNTVTGFTYTVQYKNSLGDTGWQSLQSVTGDETVKSITNSLANAPQRFYRLSVQ